MIYDTQFLLCKYIMLNINITSPGSTDLNKVLPKGEWMIRLAQPKYHLNQVWWRLCQLVGGVMKKKQYYANVSGWSLRLGNLVWAKTMGKSPGSGTGPYPTPDGLRSICEVFFLIKLQTPKKLENWIRERFFYSFISAYTGVVFSRFSPQLLTYRKALSHRH